MAVLQANTQRPVVWAVAGNDSGGGAGLSADARAAQAFDVHLCPVVAALTAQNSQAVTQVEPVAPQLLEAQLAALADDLPPLAIKTGLLGSADNIAVLARWVDRLRARQPVALVLDPVLGASTGAAFANTETLRAWRELLLPRASLVTPNLSEARRLLDQADASAPELARQLRAAGVHAVAITGGDAPAAQGWTLDWIDTPQAQGWLGLPRLDTPHNHGTGCTFASSAASALARGFVAADAVVLAKMATHHALAHGHAAGQGAGPVWATPGFATQAERLPLLSWDEHWLAAPPAPAAAPALGLYAIVDRVERVSQVLQAGVRTVQLRIKTDSPTPPNAEALRAQLSQAWAACREAGATLVVNDHWQLAMALAQASANPDHLALHLGQEDLQVLGTAGRQRLTASGLPLGISSHSLWELCRARALAPWYVACGPVWPTLTKAMPWHPQGLDNLAWWVHMAGAPVVAIGGILQTDQAQQAARSGAAGVCVVRGLGDDPARTVPLWQASLQAGRAETPLTVPAWPHPSLASEWGRAQQQTQHTGDVMDASLPTGTARSGAQR